MKPLVSILIPAYNAESFIGDTLRSALAQTWLNTEIIVVDDGSQDGTLTVARSFASSRLRVISQPNQGAAAARNHALSICQGEFIQWLDADDLLAPDKVERQMDVFEAGAGRRTLLSSAWGSFYFRPARAVFRKNLLWGDLSPVDWLVHKLAGNVFMQTGVWLVSRELTARAGQWDTRLLSDDDGEYFCRVMLASERVCFVPEAKVFYRDAGAGSLSYVGHSRRKLEALLLSMRLHIGYVRSLEDSERVRRACLTYLQTGLPLFYPDFPDLVAEFEKLAAELGGRLEPVRLSWKYVWLQKLAGWRTAKQAQLRYNRVKRSCIRGWDRALSLLG